MDIKSNRVSEFEKSLEGVLTSVPGDTPLTLMIGDGFAVGTFRVGSKPDLQMGRICLDEAQVTTSGDVSFRYTRWYARLEIVEGYALERGINP